MNSFECKKNMCQFELVTAHYILQFIHCQFHDDIYMCPTHKYIHICDNQSSDCQLFDIKMGMNSQCIFTNKVYSKKTDIRKRVNVDTIKQRSIKNYTILRPEKVFGKYGKSLKTLEENGVNLTTLGIPSKYSYHAQITENMNKNNLSNIIDTDIFHSAVHRTYNFFMNYSTQNMWREHLDIICTCFVELFSKSNTQVGNFGVCDLRLRKHIKFIISMEMMNKKPCAPPLIVEELYVKRRHQRFGILNKQKRKKNHKRLKNVSRSTINRTENML